MMEFMEELKELCHKGEQIVHKMQQSGYGQRRYGRYGMREGYHDGYGGGYEDQKWDSPQMHDGYHEQHWQDVNPRMFM